MYGYGNVALNVFAPVRGQWELLSDRTVINDMENDMNAIWLSPRNREH